MDFSKMFTSKYYIATQITAVLLLGIGSAWYIGDIVAEKQKESLINRVSVIAKTIHRSPILQLKGDERDLESTDYAYLKKKMVDIKAVSPDARFVYLMGYRDDIQKLFFYVDSELPGSNGYSGPGEVYIESQDYEIRNFLEGKAFADGPYTDSYGEWVSAYAPVLSPDTNLPIALIGIDTPASEYLSQIFYASALSLVISIFVALFFLVIYRIRITNKNNELNNIKMEFSSFMSHEIRGFVTRIKGGLGMLYEEELGKLDQPQQSFINDLYMQAEDFGNLVEDFLEASHLERDTELVLKKQTANLVDIVKGAAGDLKDSLAKKDISIVYEGNLPEKVFSDCDGSKIGRVFTNIIANSIKYSPDRSSIRVGYIDNGDMHTIYLKDTGIGIPVAEQGNLFKKFYRASNARTVHISGTGLGLYFSKIIIEKHKGKIWFESTEGGGSTFYVSFLKKI